MSHSNKSFSTTVPPGFYTITRRDGIFQEKVHDAYKLRGKLHEPTVCPECNAVFHEGRWQWLPAPANAHQEMCSACHRIHDHYPAGFLTLEGPFFLAHREEIMHLVHHEEKYQRAEHPVKRIMEIEEKPDSTLITTTDIHLARGMGEKIHDSYQGELEFHYNPEENLLRVSWSR
ncbi:BCAM0308 family protein [Nitrosomonas communis]|uniref:BCAM0308 family protein n=1 Tax=Nitrosomonas communis TaxID=44574 RepID=UPI003D27EEC5